MKKVILFLSTQILIVFLLLNCTNTSKKPSKITENKPNIIFILADDLGYGDLGCYGQAKFETPNLDQLASEGLMFTQHYSGSTVCAPSRATLMTGQHTGHAYVRGNKSFKDENGERLEGQFPLADSIVTVAEKLKEAGYVTGMFGKWGLGAIGSEGEPTNQGFDEFYGYACQGLAHRYYPTHLWHNTEKVVLEGNDGTQTVQYSSDLIQDKTLEFIKKNKDKPFFLYVPSTIPHAELIAPDDEILAEFKGKFPEVPYKGKDYDENYNPWGYCSQEIPHAMFAAMVTRLDKQVGEITTLLNELGISENTLVLFSSDNGPHLEGGADPDFFDSNGPLKGYKRDLYEGGVRAPMIARWPAKIKAGTETDHISAFWDFFPTVVEIAGGKVPSNIDGISFLPTLLGNEDDQKEHEYLYWEFHEKNKRQGIRMGKWKGVIYDIATNPDAKLELYDLSQDIGEENDVAEQHPEIVEKLEAKLKKARTADPNWKFFENE